MLLRGTWEFWADPSDEGEAVGVFLPGGGTGVTPDGAAGSPGAPVPSAVKPEWREIAVPGHWQAQPGFADVSGPGWYRLRFAAPVDAAGHPFLEFAGVDFYADLWLNGEYLGFHGRPVSLVFRPTLHVSGLAVTPYLAPDCRQADLVVQIAVENDSDRPITEPLRILVAPHNFAGGAGVRHPLIVTFPPGRSEHTFTVTLKRPELWWTWDLGFPSLYKAMILVGGEAVPQAETLFGIREFKKGEDWSLWLNGERLFARGTNYLPDRFLSRMTPERLGGGGGPGADPGGRCPGATRRAGRAGRRRALPLGGRSGAGADRTSVN